MGESRFEENDRAGENEGENEVVCQLMESW